MVKLTLDGTNSSWPTCLLGVVGAIQCELNCWEYRIDYSTADLNGGPEPKSCNYEIKAYCCEDELADLKASLA